MMKKLTSALLVQEGATLYKNIESGKLDVAGYIEQFKNVLPPYFQHLLDRFGMGNLEGLREKIVKSAMQGSQFFATQAFSFGQGTFDFLVSFFIMLYLLYFLLRDGRPSLRPWWWLGWPGRIGCFSRRSRRGLRGCKPAA
jgi:predicted PurR-regulated permease PerM